jgi:hypothetical protein
MERTLIKEFVKKCYLLTYQIKFNLYLRVFKSLLIIFCCLLSVLTIKAQTVFNGRVFENKTRIALRSVRVENLNNDLKAITGEDGRFSIGAKVGDLLVLKGFSYQTDTLLLTDMHDKEVFLQPQTTMLNQVTITDSSGRTANANKNMKFVDPEFHGQTAVYQRDKEGNYDGGVTLRLHYFTKDERDKKKAAMKDKDRATSEHISQIFTADNISKYVPLKGDDMNNFLLLYTPEVETYTNKDFNLLAYLNACYKEWGTLTPEQKKEGQVKF